VARSRPAPPPVNKWTTSAASAGISPRQNAFERERFPIGAAKMSYDQTARDRVAPIADNRSCDRLVAAQAQEERGIRSIEFQPFTVGRQFGILPSQPPNWTATEPSSFFFAVMLLLCRS
jgi:hypothetical protein